MTDLWGVCQPSGTAVQFLMKWDEGNWCYQADRAEFSMLFRGRGRAVLSAVFREIRAHVCGILAGPIADDILAGEAEISIEPYNYGSPGDDVTAALGLTGFLPWRNELDHLARVTEKALRRDDVWAMVTRLADELARVGAIDGERLGDFLPQQVPRWPNSPRAKVKPVFSVVATAEPGKLALVAG